MKTFEELLQLKRKGSLKIYLGYAAGVGKTFSMLQEGHILKSRGFDVVVGYVEPHPRPETMALLEGLEVIPCRDVAVGSRKLPEMDVDAIIKRQPQVVLVDELAHSNVEGSRYEKRYQDVLEILDHDINVISTLNIQHLESVAARVISATGAPVGERIPDFVLHIADQVVTVDVAVEELRERLRLGKIYPPDKVEVALRNFFTPNRLAYLRETCLREVAGDQFRKVEETEIVDKDAQSLVEEAVMIALSSDPTSGEVLIRKGIRLAAQLSSRVYAVYIQTLEEDPLRIDASIQRKLQGNLSLASHLGAEVVTLQGNRVSDMLVNFAHEKRIRHAVFGKSRRTPLMERIRGSILLDFIYDSIGVDVHVVNIGWSKIR